MKRESYMAWYPDGIVLLDLDWLQELLDAAGNIEIIGRKFCVATLQIKSVIAENTVASYVQSSSIDLLVFQFVDDNFKKYSVSEKDRTKFLRH